MRRVIGWNQLALICKHRMGGCGIKMGSTRQDPCSNETCPILRQLPDVEPILEAVKRIEWIPQFTKNGSTMWACPSCGRTKVEGHTKGCELQDALKTVEIESKERK